MTTETSKMRKVTPADVDRVREAVRRAWGDECAAKVCATERGISIEWPGGSVATTAAHDVIRLQGMRWGAEGWICDWPEPGAARPITRADEMRVREVVAKAEATLRWIARRDPVLSWTDAGALFAVNGYRAEGTGTLWDEFAAALARAGIVPGPEGWCWAATAEPAPAEPPAWLRDAVLAALPVDGTPCSLSEIVTALRGASAPVAAWHEASRRPLGHQALDALARFVDSGEVESVDVNHWRRWGVPEGWAWRPLLPSPFAGAGGEECRPSDGSTRHLWAFPDGSFSVNPGSGWPGHALSSRASSDGLPAAKRAAVRAAWERGLFAAPAKPKTDPTVEHAPAAPLPLTRAEQVRHALLAVLTRGPVAPFARLVELLAAEGLADAPTMAEARKAAREIGALVNGARWSLPEVPPGWAWEPSKGLAHSYLRRRHQHVANVTDSGSWFVYPVPSERAIEDGKAADPTAAQAEALYAARRAGLFDVAAPAEERTPSPTATGLSADCQALDDAKQAGDVERLALLADRWLHERDAGRADTAKRQAWELNDFWPRVDRLAELVSAPEGATVDHVLDLAIAALARTVDTGPAREDPPGEPHDDSLRAVADAIVGCDNGDALATYLRAWGASLVAEARSQLPPGAKCADCATLSERLIAAELAEARAGLTVPHEVVHQQLAERADAEDALYLFDVYQAAMRWREVRLSGRFDIEAYANTLRALDVLLAREPKPREPAPHPHRDGNEEPQETIGRLARERDEARLEAEAAMARAEKAERELSVVRETLDALRERLAKGRAT